jgi:hypothetical protein
MKRTLFGTLRVLLPLLSLAILLAGCASDHPTVGARRGAGFSPTPTDKIALTLMRNPSDEDAELGRLLTAELKREGFNLVPPAEADYTLAYAVEDDSVASYVPARNFVVPNPAERTEVKVIEQTGPEFAGFVPPPLGPTPSAPPEVVVYHTKGIRLYLYSNPKTHSGKFEVAWSGCIDAGEKITANRAPRLIQTLLGYFGQDYRGRVNLDQHPRSPPAAATKP